MGRLIYSAITSLDGYTVDADGNFDWGRPGADVHAFVNDLERPYGTNLYGRRMFEVMKVWQDIGPDQGHPEVMLDYAEVWRGADKVVYSATLEAVDTPRTRLEPAFDTEAVRRLVIDADKDVSIGGATLAAEALRAGLVDEIHQFVTPHIVGGGIRFLPDGVRIDLELTDERRFDDGTVHLAYRVVS